MSRPFIFSFILELFLALLHGIRAIDHVAVCLIGQARSFWEPEQHGSLLKNLRQLQDTGIAIDVFIAFDFDDQQAVSIHVDIMNALRPRDMRLDYPAECETSDIPFCKQWFKYRSCLDMIIKAEHALTVKYVWTLRLRPDTRWTAPFPSLIDLDSRFVYSRLACPGMLRIRAMERSWGPLETEKECIPLVSDGSALSCLCNLWGCHSEVPVVDDQAAWIPRTLLESYLLVTQLKASHKHRNHFQEMFFTALLMERQVRVRPLAFEFQIIHDKDDPRVAKDGMVKRGRPDSINPQVTITCDNRPLFPTQHFREVCRPGFHNRFCDNFALYVSQNSTQFAGRPEHEVLSDMRIATLRIWLQGVFISGADEDDVKHFHIYNSVARFMSLFCPKHAGFLIVNMFAKRHDVEDGCFSTLTGMVWVLFHEARDMYKDVELSAQNWLNWVDTYERQHCPQAALACGGEEVP